MDNIPMNHEQMDTLDEDVDVSRELTHNPPMTPFKEYEDQEREWKEEKVTLEMRLKASEEKLKQMEYNFKYAMETEKQNNKVAMDQLKNESQILKNLLSDLHKYVMTFTELDDSAFEESSTFKPDPTESNLYRQAQDIYNKLKEIKETESLKAKEQRLRDMEDELRMAKESIEHNNEFLKADEQKLRDLRYTLGNAMETTEQKNEVLSNELENENQILKTLLSDLHLYAISNTDKNISNSDPSNRVKFNPSVATVYQQAQDIYNQLQETKEKESETESAGKQLYKLISIILEDGGHHTMVTTGREKKTKAVSQSLLKQPDRHNENLKLALSELQQMKQRSRECETLHQRLHEGNERVSKVENDMILLNKAWQDTYTKLHQEKERLSTIAADRLTHGNVNIADLSDPCRPTKLQEVYYELYDNEWTDAFEELEQQNVLQKDAVRMLLDILMCSFWKCREITWGRYERLKYVASSVDIAERNPFSSSVKVMSGVSDPGLVNQDQETRAQLGNSNDIEDQIVANEIRELLSPNMGAASKNKVENGKEKRIGCTVNLGIDLEKQIKDIWRTTTVALKENAIKQLPSVIETCLDIRCGSLPMTSKYLSICLDFCWKMGVQERPLHLVSVAEKRFDKEKFRTYTHSGENVDFVVWPALFLYEDGPILLKGIAQGCSSDENDKHATYV